MTATGDAGCEDTERYLRTLLALEPALREALGMPSVDENDLAILIEVAIDRLKAGTRC